jgi:hypothetical protein
VDWQIIYIFFIFFLWCSAYLGGEAKKKILILGSTHDFQMHNIGFGTGLDGART